jgi:hypothetical protein
MDFFRNWTEERRDLDGDVAIEYLRELRPRLGEHGLRTQEYGTRRGHDVSESNSCV